jgi:hypothetical protein
MFLEFELLEPLLCNFHRTYSVLGLLAPQKRADTATMDASPATALRSVKAEY